MTWTINFSGLSGQSHKYWNVDLNNMAALLDEAGNYGFLKAVGNNHFVPLYFGVADSLRNRLRNHERWAEAVAAGATHIVAHTTPAGEKAQLFEERDLIAKWNPPLNKQHRTTG